MNQPIDGLLFLGLEVASFVGAILLYFRSRRRARGMRRRYVRGVRIIVAYALLLWFCYGVLFYLPGGYPLAGAVIFGGIIAAFHVMLLAAVFLFAGIMFLAGGD